MLAATWDDLRDVPEGFVGEIVGGEVVVRPSPNVPHALVASGIHALLGGPFGLAIGGPGGWIGILAARIRFLDDIRVPDIAGWRIERFTVALSGPQTIIPDWICEVLSPSTEDQDRGSKMELYLRAGVKHLWLASWRARYIEIFHNESGRWVRGPFFSGDTRIRAAPFDAAEIDLSLLWKHLPPRPTEE